MAIKPNSKKVRLDFSQMLESAMPDFSLDFSAQKTDENETNTVFSTPTVTEEPIDDVRSEPISEEVQSSVEMHSDFEDFKHESYSHPTDVIDATPQYSSQSSVQEQSSLIRGTDQYESLFTPYVKKKKGTAKNVYLEEDVYQFLQAVADRYNVSFSKVINILIQDLIKTLRKKS